MEPSFGEDGRDEFLLFITTKGKAASLEPLFQSGSLLAESKKIVIISTLAPSGAVFDALEKNGVDSGKVFLIDCSLNSPGSERIGRAVHVKSLRNLSSIAIAISGATESESPVLVYLDSLNEFSSRITKREFDAFLYSVLIRLRLRGHCAVLVAVSDEKKMTERELGAIGYLCDKTIKI